MEILNIDDLINNENIKLQIGFDKNKVPIFLGDMLFEDVEQWYSNDYWNGYDPRVRDVPSSEKKLYKGRVFRKVEFKNAQFSLVRKKEEGLLPCATSAEVPAIQRWLNNYVKAE
jgi:hypothetical protein